MTPGLTPDDADLITLAKMYGVETLTSLKLPGANGLHIATPTCRHALQSAASARHCSNASLVPLSSSTHDGWFPPIDHVTDALVLDPVIPCHRLLPPLSR